MYPLVPVAVRDCLFPTLYLRRSMHRPPRQTQENPSPAAQLTPPFIQSPALGRKCYDQMLTRTDLLLDVKRRTARKQHSRKDRHLIETAGRRSKMTRIWYQPKSTGRLCETPWLGVRRQEMVWGTITSLCWLPYDCHFHRPLAQHRCDPGPPKCGIITLVTWENSCY
jgi:murein endopeptidase